MSRRDFVVLASRTLAVILTILVLAEISYLPECVQSFLHYLRYETTSSTNMAYLDYMRHYYLLRLGFLITRIVGYSLMAMWLRKSGPGVEELLLPQEEREMSMPG